MSIADFILSFGGVVFFLALIPAFRSPIAPPFRTSIVTGAVLVSYVGALASLGAYLGAASTALTAVGWLYLAFRARVLGYEIDPYACAECASEVGAELRSLALTAEEDGGDTRVSSDLLHEAADLINGIRP